MRRPSRQRSSPALERPVTRALTRSRPPRPSTVARQAFTRSLFAAPVPTSATSGATTVASSKPLAGRSPRPCPARSRACRGPGRGRRRRPSGMTRVSQSAPRPPTNTALRWVFSGRDHGQVVVTAAHGRPGTASCSAARRRTGSRRARRHRSRSASAPGGTAPTKSVNPVTARSAGQRAARRVPRFVLMPIDQVSGRSSSRLSAPPSSRPLPVALPSHVTSRRPPWTSSELGRPGCPVWTMSRSSTQGPAWITSAAGVLGRRGAGGHVVELRRAVEGVVTLAEDGRRAERRGRVDDVVAGPRPHRRPAVAGSDADHVVAAQRIDGGRGVGVDDVVTLGADDLGGARAVDRHRPPLAGGACAVAAVGCRRAAAEQAVMSSIEVRRTLSPWCRGAVDHRCVAGARSCRALR